MQLSEDKRQQLISKSKSSEKGNQRYKRRTKSKVANSVKEFNSIDMNKLFKDDILTVNIKVQGETDNYLVRISFGGFLDILYDMLQKNNNVLNLKVIIQSLITGFNRDDVYIDCSCPDFRYRYKYWATKNNFNSGEEENRPSDITNPEDKLGSGCKHILLVLSNNRWVWKVASVINNYIIYMDKHMHSMYAKIIYPAIYRKEYEEPVQMSLFDTDDLDSQETTIDDANAQGRTRGQFKTGNPWRYQPKQQNDENNNQLTFDDNEENN